MLVVFALAAFVGCHGVVSSDGTPRTLSEAGNATLAVPLQADSGHSTHQTGLAVGAVIGAVVFVVGCAGVVVEPGNAIVVGMAFCGPVILVPCTVFYAATLEIKPPAPPVSVTAQAAAGNNTASMRGTPNLYHTLVTHCSDHFPAGYEDAYLDLFSVLFISLILAVCSIVFELALQKVQTCVKRMKKTKEPTAAAAAATTTTRMELGMDVIVVLCSSANSLIAILAGLEYYRQFLLISGTRSCRFNCFLSMSMFKPVVIPMWSNLIKLFTAMTDSRRAKRLLQWSRGCGSCLMSTAILASLCCVHGFMLYLGVAAAAAYAYAVPLALAFLPATVVTLVGLGALVLLPLFSLLHCTRPSERSGRRLEASARAGRTGALDAPTAKRMARRAAAVHALQSGKATTFVLVAYLVVRAW